MRYVAMQLLTWGTIVGACVSALLLAALQGPPASYTLELGMSSLPSEPYQPLSRPQAAPITATGAASAPRFTGR